MERTSINSSLPPLKCAYVMAPINEEPPYIAMEDLLVMRDLEEQMKKEVVLFIILFPILAMRVQVRIEMK